MTKKVFFKKKNKFNARKVLVDDIKFDSQGEAFRYKQLLEKQEKGEISELKRQVKYSIDINDMHICNYIADFEYLDHATGGYITEDYKGMDTPNSRLKRKLVLAIHGVDVRVVKGA